MIIYSDGYTLGKNPSEKGGGYVVMSESGEILAEKEIAKKGMTNNEIELLGVLEASKLAEKYDTIITDSMNTYWWVTKRKCKARPDLKEKATEAYINILEKQIDFYQEPRETNLAGIYIEDILKK